MAPASWLQIVRIAAGDGGKRSAKVYNYTGRFVRLEPPLNIHSMRALFRAHRSSRMMAFRAARAVLKSPRVPMPSLPSKSLETFDNPAPNRDFAIHMEVPEFTCLCPLTGQPDFASIIVDYIPDARCVELKSLKLYMWSYRNEGAFHEAVTNRILDDLADATQPRFMRVTAKWYVRGGIFTNVIVEHRKAGWASAPRVDLPGFELSSPMASPTDMADAKPGAGQR